jgi:hypothetical protein
VVASANGLGLGIDHIHNSSAMAIRLYGDADQEEPRIYFDHGTAPQERGNSAPDFNAKYETWNRPKSWGSTDTNLTDGKRSF